MIREDSIEMINVFENAGATAFDLTTTDEQGKKQEFQRLSGEQLRMVLPELLRLCEQAKLNVIVRPQPKERFIQLDDLDPAKVERVRELACMIIETSPGNFQAWIAIEDRTDDLVRRLKQGIGTDKSASGATRIAGSRNFKPKHSPSYPVVKLIHTSNRVLKASELEHLLAPPESKFPQSQVSPAPCSVAPTSPFRDIANNPSRHNGNWPDYNRELATTPKARKHSGPDRSNADFNFCLKSIDPRYNRGFAVEETADQLMKVSEKAQECGYKYALQTARSAQAVVERRIA